MSSEGEQQRSQGGEEIGVEDHGGHGRDLVTISINGVPVEIHRGRRSVAEIKRVGGVPDTDELAQQVEGKLKPLPDEGHVVIKGGELFISYPRACASS